jgi:hypothetical protein
MEEREWLVDQFQAHRAHLRAATYRMLGSLDEVDDAVRRPGYGSAAPTRAPSRTWAGG